MSTTDSIPTSMRVSELLGQDSLVVTERSVPVPAAGEVLVRVTSVGVCGSDTHYFTHGRIGPFVVEKPLVLGHEASGVIAAVGAGVDSARIGSRVSIEPQRPCRVCEQCKKGAYNLCPDMQFFATPPIDGAFAEYVTIQSDFAHDVPDSVTAHAAALMEPLSVGIWACEKAQVTAGSRVLIAGAGPIGVITAQVAQAMGAVEVIVTDVSEQRLAFARSHGATRTLVAGEAVDEMIVDAFIDASGAGRAIRAGIPAVMRGGRVVSGGLAAHALTLPVNLLQNRELWLTGVFRYANTWPTAIELVASGRVNLDVLVTHAFGLNEVQDALMAGRLPGALKAVVEPWR